MTRRYFRMTPKSRREITEIVSMVPNGCFVEIREATRSVEQNARLHAMLSDVADQVTWYGRKLSIEAWKRVFSAALQDIEVVPGINPGTFVPIWRHTSEMTVAELRDLMTLIEAFGAEHGVVFRQGDNHAERRS